LVGRFGGEGGGFFSLLSFAFFLFHYLKLLDTFTMFFLGVTRSLLYFDQKLGFALTLWQFASGSLGYEMMGRRKEGDMVY
jgi:hypothetical protein